MSQLRILHVEDDPDDALFFFRAIKKTHPNCAFHRETNGEGAINFLRQTAFAATTPASPRPDLMILDLKLPGLSGFEVLAWTRSQAAFKTLPIVILSGSSLEQDRKKAADLGASAFLVKHSRYDQIVGQIAAFLAQNLSTPAGTKTTPTP
jgi:DNA-binding response OmpR family regulator